MQNRREDKAAPGAAAPAEILGHLCLYVAGPSARAALAEANVRRCCGLHFAGQYQLEVIDVAQQPELARREQLLALPTLVRRHPAPTRYLLGTLTDEAKLLRGLALSPAC